jgi:hypothetical protein
MAHWADSPKEKADAGKIIDWQIRCLLREGTMSESELNLLISFEKQFKRTGTLSERQMEVLESIYKRRS